MAKVADSYFKIDPWKIVEEGFAPEYAMTAESVFPWAMSTWESEDILKRVTVDRHC